MNYSKQNRRYKRSCGNRSTIVSLRKTAIHYFFKKVFSFTNYTDLRTWFNFRCPNTGDSALSRAFQFNKARVPPCGGLRNSRTLTTNQPQGKTTCLPAYQVPVYPTGCHQTFMPAILNDPAPFQHQNTVGMLNGGQAVGNQKGSAAAHQFL